MTGTILSVTEGCILVVIGGTIPVKQSTPFVFLRDQDISSSGQKFESTEIFYYLDKQDLALVSIFRIQNKL